MKNEVPYGVQLKYLKLYPPPRRFLCKIIGYEQICALMVRCCGIDIRWRSMHGRGDGVVDIEDLKVFIEYWEKENILEIPEDDE